MEYSEFLSAKSAIKRTPGIDAQDADFADALFPFQMALVKWALARGRVGLFADTGLGKTPMQVEWARIISQRTGSPVLIVAPLCVAQQTIEQAARINGVEIRYDRAGYYCDGITITNYEMVDAFDPSVFSGVVLDESSILKSIAGKTREKLIEMFQDTPYRLACTATPAPNDIAEIGNHAQFLGICSRAEMLARFFVHDQDGWRLKGHARTAFYEWLASWSMSVKRPSDIGFKDDGYDLPGLELIIHTVDAEFAPDGRLFFTGLKGIGDRAEVRKKTVAPKIAKLSEIITDEQWLIWCGTNAEAELSTRAINGCNVTGSDPIDSKVRNIMGFAHGEIGHLVTKPKIAGLGMNFQNCHNMAFVGLSDSWEQYYQCIRRCHRYGQTETVRVHIIISEPEKPILQNVLNKETEASRMSDELISAVKRYELDSLEGGASFDYNERTESGDGWTAHLGDSCEVMPRIQDNWIDMSVFSPPFESLYTYTPTDRDLGNSKDRDEFLMHFSFIAKELFRITKPGRIAAVHVADIPAMLVRDGYIGLKDFSGDVIRLFISLGWVFDSRIPIDKNQQAQSIRTHSKALTMTQLEKDRTWSRPALPDYILKFRKPGANQAPVNSSCVTRDEWIEFANPTWPGGGDRCLDAGAFSTWYGISETETLNYKAARGSNDERHICPLQIGTIERCVRLWSNPGELVFTPFAGVFSEVHTAVRLGRRALGIELKPEYFAQGVRNMSELQKLSLQSSLF